MQMPSNPKSAGDHLKAIMAGWEEHAADATFSGLTLARFKAKVKPLLDARAEIENLNRQIDGGRVERSNADVIGEEIANNVVNSVKGNPNYGENSALYASFGYLRKDDRKSGLSRAANNVAPQASAKLKIVAYKRQFPNETVAGPAWRVRPFVFGASTRTAHDDRDEFPGAGQLVRAARVTAINPGELHHGWSRASSGAGAVLLARRRPRSDRRRR